MTMELLPLQQTASPKPTCRIFQPSELLQSFQTRNFSALCLSSPRQTNKGTYLNLSATTDGKTFSPLYVVFKDLKFVGQSSVPSDETRGSGKNEKGTYDPTFKFQKFAEDGTVQPLFEVPEKLQEYLFAIMEDKIKNGEIACLDHRMAHMPTALTKGRNGSYVYKPKTVDGQPVTAANLCKVLTSGTLGSGVMDVSSVVCSTFDISLPRWVLFLLLAPPPARKPTIHDCIAAMHDQLKQDLEKSNADNDRSTDLSEISVDDLFYLED